MIPEKIGRYVIESELGRGGMATVYKAYDPRFERTVAIKVLPREFLHEPEFRARFNREAKIIAALEHPAIVPVYDFGEEDGQPYLVMRYMPGGSLADRLREGPIPIEEAARILQRLGSALDRAHSQGIIHRDLKPSNILFDQYGDAYLADFGIVHVASSSQALTASGSLVGTPMYMSPEQVYGDKELDGRSDIYALGIILFQMLTGQLPYEADTPAKVMMKHVLDPIPNIREVRPDLPPACEDVIAKAMAKEREQRFPTASDLANRLTAVTQKNVKLETADVAAEIARREAEDASAPVETAVESPPPAEIPQTPQIPTEAPPVSSGLSGLWQRLPAWAIGLIVVACLGCFGLTGLTVWLATQVDESLLSGETTPTISPFTTPTEAPTVTTEMIAAAPAEPTETPLPTPTVLPTNTAVSSPTLLPPSPQADLTATAVLATRESLAATRDAEAGSFEPPPDTFTFPPLLGPVSGELLHDNDDFIESVGEDLNLADFMVITHFFVPFDITSGNWDFGYFFRQDGPDNEYRLVIRANGLWNLNNRFDGEDHIVQEGDVSDILLANEGADNEIILIAQGTRGFFWLNGRFVSQLDLSDRPGIGDIAVATGFYNNSEIPGAATAYDDFTVWALEPEIGPLSGELAHTGDDTIKTEYAGVALKNFMVEALFYNPYSTDEGIWDAGFAFRDLGVADQYWLIIDSEQTWNLIDRFDGDDFFVDNGPLDNLDLSAGGANKLLLIVLDAQGFVFVNDEFVAVLDLTDRLDAGDIAVATAFFVGDEVVGKATAYEGFIIWPLP